MIKIAFIDVIGLQYDGSTLTKQGLGGSESAIIYMSRELAKLGFHVDVYNNCQGVGAPGTYDGVNYRPLKEAATAKIEYDVVISSRTVIPFLPEHMWNVIVHDLQHQYKPFMFAEMVKRAKYKVLWMHDTFCAGDEHLEYLIVNGFIDRLFTLSDWHTSYVTTCDHGHKRMFEVLKDHVWQTRNGVTRHIDWVDVQKKDPDLFVYNASVTKGLVPLVEHIWPQIKQRIPTAKLKVVGGFYRFDENSTPDAQENTWVQLRDQNTDKDVEYTGIITQQEIAELLSRASYFLYPSEFPETFGISTLEALAYNVPIVTCRFGALEEVAVELASYKIDYPIVPNGLYPNINADEQIAKFVDMACFAHQDKYLWSQKANYCNIVKDICGWDTVALQWKQHFYKVLDEFLPVTEYRQVSDINYRVTEVFGTRFSNPDTHGHYHEVEQPITIITPLYNAEKYIEKCIDSVASQNYSNYQHLIIDDCSNDNSVQIIQNKIKKLPRKIREKFSLKVNKTNVGAVKNQIENSGLRQLDPHQIVLFLDGDDYLVNNPNIFTFLSKNFREKTDFTYGSCWSLADNIPLVAQPYPPEVIEAKSFRDHKFAWGMPYPHLRAFRKSLIDNIPNSTFQDDNGEWFRAGGDNAVFFSLIEQASSIKAVPDIIYNYNDLNPLNDYKVNGEEQNNNATFITEKKEMKKILIALPTKKDIEADTFKSIYDLDVPEGYSTELQFFYGYQIDQVRNLIAEWGKHYDYVFCVDSDIVLPQDSLIKMLAANKDMISGVYVQRKEEKIVELYDHHGRNIPLDEIEGKGVFRVGACGFGCVLVNSNIFRSISYPHFEYHSAINHSNTLSEDVDFCRKAEAHGFEIWADETITCDHIGQTRFTVHSPVQQNLARISSEDMLPPDHVAYLKTMNIQPKVIFDIGACVLHWSRHAAKTWPGAEIFLFDELEEAEFLWKRTPHQYHIGVLTDFNDKIVDFWKDPMNPGGNSLYKETSGFYNDSHRIRKVGTTLDYVVRHKGFPWPDLIKLDVQGAELDILRGAESCLMHTKDIILEAQHTNYNDGAPKEAEVIQWMKDHGFELVSKFCSGDADSDYHFSRPT